MLLKSSANWKEDWPKRKYTPLFGLVSSLSTHTKQFPKAIQKKFSMHTMNISSSAKNKWKDMNLIYTLSWCTSLQLWKVLIKLRWSVSVASQGQERHKPTRKRLKQYLFVVWRCRKTKLVKLHLNREYSNAIPFYKPLAMQKQ